MSMPGHIHLMLLLGPLLMAFGIIYAILPDLTKKHMSKNLGEIHFLAYNLWWIWLSTISIKRH